jgi:hypothetical protein
LLILELVILKDELVILVVLILEIIMVVHILYLG